ncbi:cytochrome c oxidase subunit 4 isoform 1, mitochondrial-like [Centruroides vittatus]|uniref:cytochrome c oxidase subunit 4 isoform 1, mitochondrial-like n=1 Tax=Centruroides vittatus TaxID=120091 RepID=UPI00351050C7
MASHMLKVASRQLPSRCIFNTLIQPSASYYGRSLIGNRDVVGYGLNGTYMYIDRLDFPMPAIRFKENTPDVMALREKEKGDWKNLTIEEKKTLYRASFRQTFAEMKAPTGEWKVIVGWTLCGISLALWIFMFMQKFVYPPLPESFTPEGKARTLKRMIQLRVNPIEGLASKFDYEKGQWK